MILGDWKCTVVGFRTLVKSFAGLPSRRAVAGCRSMSEDQFWAHQSAAFRRAYMRAREVVPFYRDRPDRYPAAPELSGKDTLLAFLAQLPLLTKEELRAHNDDFRAPVWKATTREHRTSGTSGTPLRLYATIGEKGRQQAIMEDWLLQITGRRRPRCLHLSGFMTPSSGADLFWTDRLTGDTYLSIYSLNAASRSPIIRLLKSRRFAVISGYASAVYELAALLGPAAADTRHHRVAVTTSEVLHDHWRTAIQDHLCHRVYDVYGSQEGCHLALECPAQRRHIHPMAGIVELLTDDGRSAMEGETGSVAVTGLLRHSMPLFRYDLGDTGQSTGYAADCDCGLRWPTMGTIAGRSEDLVRTRNGRRIGYLTFHATRNLNGVRECQLVQTGYEQFTCNIVVDDATGALAPVIQAHIRGELARRLGFVPDLRFCVLTSIPRGARGKFSAVVVDFRDDG